MKKENKFQICFIIILAIAIIITIIPNVKANENEENNENRFAITFLEEKTRKPLSEIEISLQSLIDQDDMYYAVSDESGVAMIENLPLGDYKVRVVNRNDLSGKILREFPIEQREGGTNKIISLYDSSSEINNKHVLFTNSEDSSPIDGYFTYEIVKNGNVIYNSITNDIGEDDLPSDLFQVGEEYTIIIQDVYPATAVNNNVIGYEFVKQFDETESEYSSNYWMVVPLIEATPTTNLRVKLFDGDKKNTDKIKAVLYLKSNQYISFEALVDENGQVEFENIPQGIYEFDLDLSESKYYSGFENVDIDVTSGKNDEFVDVVLENKLESKTAEVHVFVKEAESFAGSSDFMIPGCSISIENQVSEEDSYIGDATTSKDGEVCFYDVPYDDYSVMVYKVGNDYYELEDPHMFSVDNEVIVIELRLERKRGTIDVYVGENLYSRDENNNPRYPASGLLAGLSSTESDLAYNETSDDNGLIRFENIPLGQYIFTLYEVPLDFEDPEPMVLYLEESGKMRIDYDLEKKPQQETNSPMKIRIVDEETKEGIPNLIFTLVYLMDEETTMTTVTDEDGYATIPKFFNDGDNYLLKIKNLPDEYEGSENWSIQLFGGITLEIELSSKLLPIGTIVGLKGDLNNDGKVNSSDAALALQLYQENDATAMQYAFGDMNGDNRINSSDATLILEYYQNGVEEYVYFEPLD